MAKLNHENIGEVLRFTYRVGTIIKLHFDNDPEEDRRDCAVVSIEGGRTGFVPIHYHCDDLSPSWTQRENGAVVGASKGFDVGQQVIVRMRINDTGAEEPYQVVGHTAGPRRCRCCIGNVESEPGSLPETVSDPVQCREIVALIYALAERCLAAGIEFDPPGTVPYLKTADSAALIYSVDSAIWSLLSRFSRIVFSDSIISDISSSYNLSNLLSDAGYGSVIYASSCRDENFHKWLQQRIDMVRLLKYVELALSGKTKRKYGKEERNIENVWIKGPRPGNLLFSSEVDGINRINGEKINGVTWPKVEEGYGSYNSRGNLLVNRSEYSFTDFLNEPETIFHFTEVAGLPSRIISYIKQHNKYRPPAGHWYSDQLTWWEVDYNIPVFSFSMNADIPGSIWIVGEFGESIETGELPEFSGATGCRILANEKVNGELSMEKEIQILPEPSGDLREIQYGTGFDEIYLGGFRSVPVEWFGVYVPDFQYK